ncbi:DNA polymerase III subunit alpha [Domibacillus sp. PGB-M46]|uniref:DNA polymerase III subunit alpha n=1 Tax=Domibacillus sp. PGB-M46 TaxID=2910255 RepID=UPI001F5AB53D|nr:DNA polymerase III subunit alpha [Domibacillus sp. PGB-M46]MCI2254322.1 DNA polymerase III subunit alpha [Domibacillus sp. PGB-M46]
MIQLETETAYSFRGATLTPEQIAQKTQEAGQKAVALTDWNNLHGAIPFYLACQKRGIKPIMGLKAEVEAQQESGRAYPLLLYAQNDNGFSNLIKISSALQTKAEAGLPLRWLNGYAKDLIAVLPGLDGDPSGEALAFFKEVFQHFYIGLRGTRAERFLIEKARADDIPVVAIGHVQYADPAGAFASACLQAIRDNRLIEPEEELTEAVYSFKSEAEWKELYQDIPEAMDNTAVIARLCDVNIKFGSRLLPAFPLPEGESADERLKNLCMEGLRDRSDPAYIERLSYELSVISRMNFSDYFLIVHDFVHFAKKQGILTGPGRGSAAGSLVAFALGITAVDPIRHNLLFERFLNPERITMPDIDIDFPDYRRDEVIRYITQKYGAVHAAQIVTFGTLSAKAVMRDTARVFGFESGELSRLSKLIPSTPGTKLSQVNLGGWRAESPVHERIYQTALRLEGLPRHTSTHAAGIVMTEKPLTDHVPIMKGHDEVYLTQYPMEPLEQLGLLKIDLLGLRNLTTIERIIASIRRKTGRRIDLLSLSLDDHDVFKLLGEGKTAGIFQFESEGMKNVLTQLQPNRFEDMVAVNALYRPGPMEQIPTYIKRRHGQESLQYPHPVLKEILEPTYGIIVYQEQIIQIAVQLSGFTPGEADLLRRAVSKKKKETLEQERKHFVSGAVQNGVDENIALFVYDLIVRFADYGFNRSHAVAYSMIAYWLAWLKVHYPAHFLAALLQSQTGNEEKMRQYAAEAAEYDLSFLAPSVNMSSYSFQAEQDGIRFGLVPVKGVGQTVAKTIIEERKEGRFQDLFDFCQRVPANIVNRKAIESLIYAGAMDEFGQDRAVLLASIDAAIEHAALIQPDEGSLFEGLGVSFHPKYADVTGLPVDIKLEKEREMLGLYVSDHPIAIHRKVLAQAGAVPVIKVQSGRKVITAGMIGSIREIRTKKGDKMAFSSLADETGEREMILFPEAYRKHGPFIEKGKAVLVKGSAEERNGSLQLIVHSLEPIQEGINKTMEKKQVLFIQLPEGKGESELAGWVVEELQLYPGQASVVIHYERTKETVRLGPKYKVSPKEELIEGLKKKCGTRNVVLKSFD